MRFKLSRTETKPVCTAEKNSIKSALRPGKVKFIIPIKVLSRRERCFFSETHIFHIPGKQFLRLIKDIPFFFPRNFFKNSERSESLQQSSFFKIGGTPVLKITEEQRQFLNTIFQKIIAEQESDYVYKDELIRNYISLIIHESLKLEPAEDFDQNKNAASRLSSVFLELLERQFPIETTHQSLQLKSAQDFAKNLNVHVNYLNRTIKEVTGKSTTAHITERILTEAKALLQHTDWNISEIAFALGFDYPTYFNNFFKKQTGANPKAFRLTEV